MHSSYACPQCEGELHKDGDSWVCDGCHHHFTMHVHCDKCDAEVERLKACGAVDFFCNNCNELKSKRAVIRRFEALA